MSDTTLPEPVTIVNQPEKGAELERRARDMATNLVFVPLDKDASDLVDNISSALLMFWSEGYQTASSRFHAAQKKAEVK